MKLLIILILGLGLHSCSFVGSNKYPVTLPDNLDENSKQFESFLSNTLKSIAPLTVDALPSVPVTFIFKDKNYKDLSVITGQRDSSLLITSYYLMSQSYRYMTDKDSASLANVKKGARTLINLSKVSGVKGYVARYAAPYDRLQQASFGNCKGTSEKDICIISNFNGKKNNLVWI